MNVDFSALDDIGDSPISALDLDDMDRLVRLQSTKADLTAQRDALAARKAELEGASARFRTTLAHYARQQKQHDTRARLDFYLRQNEEHAQLAAPDAAAAFVVENVGVLPSKNWGRRLEQAARFCAVQITAAAERVVPSPGAVVTERRFTLAARGVPPLAVRMCVAAAAVDSLAVENWPVVEAALAPVCADVVAFWRDNAVPRRKVDLLVAGYGALARAQRARLAVLARVVRRYRAHVVRPAQRGAALAAPEDAALASLPYAEWVFAGVVVRLRWCLVLDSAITGAVRLDLSFVAVRADGGVLPANEVFGRLVDTYGVEEAFVLMVRNMFDVEPEVGV